jgi:hypothetical protein
MSFAEEVRGKLNDVIDEVVSIKEQFVKNPIKDFTRKRIFDLGTVIRTLLTFGGNSLNKEMLDFFTCNRIFVTSSAFIQQIDKIIPEAFKYIFDKFTNAIDQKKTFDGYRLLAVDGSVFNIAYNPKDPDTYFQQSTDSKGFNQIHLNAMYDLCSKLYLDADIQPGRQKNEVRAAANMIDRSNVSGDVLLIADRGYECYNLFAHAEQKGWKYLIRVKDVGSTGIVSSLAGIPESDEFDECVHIVLTKKHTMDVRGNRNLYKFISSTAVFDFLDSDKNLFYPMCFRVVRFKLKDEKFETVITNLDHSQFPPQKLKELYNLRWGIETSFRELKYAIGLKNFHTKKLERVTQEVYAKLAMYNLSEVVIMNIIVQKNDKKHSYQVNFTMAMYICLLFLKYRGDVPYNDPEALIKSHILPVRPNRSNPRKVKPKPILSFIYRIT